MNKPIFPFSAISGQDDFKLALLLCMIDPSLGGVLAFGDKGTGKTTTVRAMQSVMRHQASDFSLVNLPIGATEDRVLGSVHLETLINEKRLEIQKGLLAKAHLGVLYIDEINLLNDYLMDVLLDASASGGYYLERDNISQWLDSQFCLVGTMNPEEGDLRPQLLDRFGLSVTIATPTEKNLRMEIVHRRLQFDSDAVGFCKNYEAVEKELADQITIAKVNLNQIDCPYFIQEAIAELCLSHHVEGLRADILLLKAARAYAAFLDDVQVTEKHLETVSHLVLLHRSKNKPNPPQNPPSKNDNHSEQQEPENSNRQESSAMQEYLLQAKDSEQFLKMAIPLSEAKNGLTSMKFGNLQQQNIGRTNAKINLLETVKQYITHQKLVIHYTKSVLQSRTHLLFVIDSSSSMLKNRQIAYIKGLLITTLQKQLTKKISFSAIALQNGTAHYVVKLSQNADDFITSLQQLKSGGKTNLKAGLALVQPLLKSKLPQEETQLYILTDGQINQGETENPFQEAVAFFKSYLKLFKNTTIVDTEKGFVRLNLAEKLASDMKVKYQLI